jgi:hypothetical protein
VNTVKFKLDVSYGDYTSRISSNTEMWVLGNFLAADVGCSEQEWPSFKDWALADKTNPNSKFTHTIGGNATFLEEDDDNDGCIHLVDATGSDEDDYYYIPARLIMTKKQFVQLLDDWQEKVCKRKPKEVTITYDGNQFAIETSDA